LFPRTLTDLLKQPGHVPSDLLPDGHIGSVQVQIGDSLSRGSPRNGTDKNHLNNAIINPSTIPQIGLPHSHNNRLQMATTIPHQAPDYTKYATLKAVESAPEEFYKRFPVMDIPPSGTLPFAPLTLHQKDIPAFQDGCALIGLATPGQKAKAMKSNAHTLATSPAFKAGWDPKHPDLRRQAYTTKRQFSIEKLPEVFNQTPTHYTHQQRPFSTNSKTEVTV
ncbi:hypothetical protein JD844_028262, partial [Phrynosoma platyrhinos]